MNRRNNSGHFVSTSFLEAAIALIVAGVIVAVVVARLPEGSVELPEEWKTPIAVVALITLAGTIGYGIWKYRD